MQNTARIMVWSEGLYSGTWQELRRTSLEQPTQMVIPTANITVAMSSKGAFLLNAVVGWARMICGEVMWVKPSTTKVQDIWRSKRLTSRMIWLAERWCHSWISTTRVTKQGRYAADIMGNLQHNLLSAKVTNASLAQGHCTQRQLHPV